MIAVSCLWVLTVAVAVIITQKRHGDPWRSMAVFSATVLLPFIGFALWVVWTVVAITRQDPTAAQTVARRRAGRDAR